MRLDTVEQALRDGGSGVRGPEGYIVAYGVAADNLRLGLDVVADSVNPLQLTRKAWRNVARRVGARFREIEIIRSDEAEHRRRVESRESQVPGLKLPSWQDVLDRAYERWPGERSVVDTGRETPAESKTRLLQALAESGVRI